MHSTSSGAPHHRPVVATPSSGSRPGAEGGASGASAGPLSIFRRAGSEGKATPAVTPYGDPARSGRGEALRHILKPRVQEASQQGKPLPSAVPSVRELRSAYVSKAMELRKEAPITTGSYSLVQKFSGQSGESAGGATGSVRVKEGGLNYQLKRHIAYATAKQKLAAQWSNVQNYGEVIGASVARALVGQSGSRPRDGMSAAGREGKAGGRADRPQLAPAVTLMHDMDRHETAAVSLYLKGGQGDIDQHYAKHYGPLPSDRKHVRLDFGTDSGPVPPGTLRLRGEAARDVQRHVATAALLGDHDINTGNLIMVGPPDAAPDGKAGEGGGQLRVGRIDFGHAFNHLIHGTGGRLVGGGGVRDASGNRILDFFNRERVRGNPLDGASGLSKLWRDYSGLLPSHEFAATLAEMASTEGAVIDQGLTEAETQFKELVKDLLLDGSPAAHEEIDDITDCLRAIAKNIGKPLRASDPTGIVEEVMGAIRAFVMEGSEQMKQVAQLCELQALIDDSLSRSPGHAPPRSGPERAAIEAAFQALAGREGKAGGASPRITWLKTSEEQPAFTGTLEGYLAHRQDELRAAATQAAKDKPRLEFEQGLHRLQADIEKIATRFPQRVYAGEQSRLQERLDALMKLPGSPGMGKKGVTWIPLGKERQGFQGDLMDYIAHRFEAAEARAG